MSVSLNRFQINSRIIIDTYAWNRFQPNNSVSVSQFARQPLSGSTHDDYDEDEEYDSDYFEVSDEGQDVPSGHVTDVVDTRKTGAANPLTEDQLLLCTTILKGYSLKEKKWRTFSFAY